MSDDDRLVTYAQLESEYGTRVWTQAMCFTHAKML